MKFCTLILLCVGIFVIAASGQPCRPENSFCINNRDCCVGLQCSMWDNRCLRPGACRNLGQHCFNDINCCPFLKCHPIQQRCARSEDVCQREGQICGFQTCCLGLRCNNGRCVR